MVPNGFRPLVSEKILGDNWHRFYELLEVVIVIESEAVLQRNFRELEQL